MIEIYTDGSCEPNPGPGAWAVIVVKDGQEVTRLSGRADHTTNNAMELTALVRAANWAAGCPAIIYSDSQYALNCLKWAAGWKSRGWKKADGGAVANVELVKELHAANRNYFSWVWVRGHNGNKWNEEADRLAEVTRGGGVECIHAVGVEYLPLSMTDKVLLETDERIGEHFRPFNFCPHCGTKL